MKLDFIPLDKLSVSKANMRYARKAPDVSDILPTVRKRGVLVPLIVRPNCAPDAFEIVAGARRFHAALLVAAERAADDSDGETAEREPLPCAILDEGDDADAIEASLIENVARLDPDEVTRWETFTRLVKEGRDPADIAQTFGLPDLAVKRVLALGNLLPRIRDLYRREKIDRATVRQLTMASKARQREWLALVDDPDARAPIGQHLKAWLLGGQAIAVKHALFDTEGMSGIVSDLFGEDAYFADPQAFWTAQEATIDAKCAGFVEAGWREAVVLPRGTYFETWNHEKAPKRKGGRVYIEVRHSGEVTIHEGYVTRSEARRIEKGEAPEAASKPARPEVTSTLGTYIDLHRHAAVRAAMTGHPALALRLMVAHAVVGSPLWTVRREMQATKSDEVRESVEVSRGEAEFDAKRRAVLALLDLSPEEPTVTGGNGDPYGLVVLFQRLLALDEAQLLDVIAVVMGETLMAGSAAVEAIGSEIVSEIGLDMSAYWQADDAFFGLLRDREVIVAMVSEVAGETIGAANAKEKGKVLKQIVRDHLAGAGGRTKVGSWVPRWLAFPPAAYTARGGVGSVEAHAKVAMARAEVGEIEAGGEADGPGIGADTAEPLSETVEDEGGEGEVEQLAA